MGGHGQDFAVGTMWWSVKKKEAQSLSQSMDHLLNWSMDHWAQHERAQQLCQFTVFLYRYHTCCCNICLAITVSQWSNTLSHINFNGWSLGFGTNKWSSQANLLWTWNTIFSLHHHSTQCTCTCQLQIVYYLHISATMQSIGYFSRIVWVLDGSHIHSAVPAFKWALHRNCKGFISHNCLFICKFSLWFLYAVTGWKESATDACIYEDACAHDLNIPAGKYYLADAGFPHCPELLVPYWGVQYHQVTIF